MNENINLWFAKDENNKITTIDKANKNNKYTCPICGGEAIPKALNSDIISPHFAHIDRATCKGETIIHWWTKNNLLKEGDVFSVFTNEEKQYLCKSVIVEKEYDTPYGKYRPDATIECYNGEIIFLEVGFTNIKKKINYIDKWNYLNKPVIEFNIRNIYDMDSLEVNMNNRFQAIYYEGVKIYKNDKNYESFKRKVESINNHEKELKDLEWFIDDIYEYKITKDEDKLDGIINEIKYIEESYTYEHALFVEKLLKTKCNSVMKNAVARKDDYYEKEIKKHFCNFRYKYDIEKFADLRLIWDKLYGSVNCQVNLAFNCGVLPPEDMELIARMINNKYKDIPYIYHSEPLGLYIRENFSLSKKDDIEKVLSYYNDELIKHIDDLLNINISIYKNCKKGIYVKSKGYILNYLDKIIEDVTNIKNNYVCYSMVNRVIPYSNEILNTEELVLRNIKEEDLVVSLIDGIEYIDMNIDKNKSMIDNIEKELKEILDYLISRNNKCEELEGLLWDDTKLLFRNGYLFENNNKKILINEDGIVFYEDLPVLNLGVDYEENLEDSISILKEFLEQKSNITPYSKQQIEILNRLKNNYRKTYKRFTVSLEKNKYVVRHKFKIVSEVPSDKKWEEVNKILSDGVRKFLYN